MYEGLNIAQVNLNIYTIANNFQAVHFSLLKK